jgi:hypothetical protein
MLVEFQTKIVQAISSGSLESVQKLVIGKHDIDRFVFFGCHSSCGLFLW